MLPSLMMPAFSPATSATVEPSSGWSSAIGVRTATSPRTRFVASHVPPIPTSNTPSATGLSANHRYASAVSASKYVTWSSPCESTSSRYGSRCSYSSANSSSVMSTPQTESRSRTDTRCGEV